MVRCSSVQEIMQLLPVFLSRALNSSQAAISYWIFSIERRTRYSYQERVFQCEMFIPYSKSEYEKRNSKSKPLCWTIRAHLANRAVHPFPLCRLGNWPIVGEFNGRPRSCVFLSVARNLDRYLIISFARLLGVLPTYCPGLKPSASKTTIWTITHRDATKRKRIWTRASVLMPRYATNNKINYYSI